MIGICQGREFGVEYQGEDRCKDSMQKQLQGPGFLFKGVFHLGSTNVGLSLSFRKKGTKEICRNPRPPLRKPSRGRAGERTLRRFPTSALALVSAQPKPTACHSRLPAALFGGRILSGSPEPESYCHSRGKLEAWINTRSGCP